MRERDFLTNKKGRDSGLDEQLWERAYQAFVQAGEEDPNPSLDKFDIERRISLTHQEAALDVYVRAQGRPMEKRVLRFSAFPASAEQDERRPDEIPLGEAALLDTNMSW